MRDYQYPMQRTIQSGVNCNNGTDHLIVKVLFLLPICKVLCSHSNSLMYSLCEVLAVCHCCLGSFYLSIGLG